MRKPNPDRFGDINPAINFAAAPRKITLHARLDDPNTEYERPIYCHMTIDEAISFRDWLTLTIEKAKGRPGAAKIANQ